jgi:hypothetical protein
METAEAVLTIETAAVTGMIGVRLIARRITARVSLRFCPRGSCLTAAAAANTRLPYIYARKYLCPQICERVSLTR